MILASLRDLLIQELHKSGVPGFSILRILADLRPLFSLLEKIVKRGGLTAFPLSTARRLRGLQFLDLEPLSEIERTKFVALGALKLMKQLVSFGGLEGLRGRGCTR